MIIKKRFYQNNPSPIFDHYCERCIFLDTVNFDSDNEGHKVWDLYWCPGPTVVNEYHDSHVVCRYGNKGYEYSSSITPEHSAEPLQFIEMMYKHEMPYVYNMTSAVQMGLYNGPYRNYFKENFMSQKDINQLIKNFINGPLSLYLTSDEISFGKFIELINEECGTNFKYSDLYPSYLFNATLTVKNIDE